MRNFMPFWSCFSAFWEVAVRDNNTKNITGLGKVTLHACIFNWMIKCNRASVASEKIFGKVRARLYNANSLCA